MVFAQKLMNKIRVNNSIEPEILVDVLYIYIYGCLP